MGSLYMTIFLDPCPSSYPYSMCILDLWLVWKLLGHISQHDPAEKTTLLLYGYIDQGQQPYMDNMMHV